MPSDKKIDIVVGEDYKQALRQLADEDGRKLSDYCARILRAHVDSQGGLKNVKPAIKKTAKK